MPQGFQQRRLAALVWVGGHQPAQVLARAVQACLRTAAAAAQEGFQYGGAVLIIFAFIFFNQLHSIKRLRQRVVYPEALGGHLG